VERRCPRRWSFAAATGLLALAVLVAGVRLRADATPAPAPVKEDEPKKEKPAKDDPKKEETKKDQPKKEERVRPGAGLERPDPFGPDFEDVFKNWKGLDADELKKIQEQMEQARKEWQKASEQWRTARPGMTLGLNWGSQSRLGAVVRQPGEALIDQLDLPKGKGLVVESVQADSAAAKAGLKPHDILLELNGKPVADNPHEFVKQLNDIKANAPVDAVVLRKGKKETIKGLTLPELKPAGVALDLGFPINPPAGGFQPFPGGFPINPPAGGFQPFPGGMIGAPGGKGVMTTTLRNDDRFTTRHQEGTLVITVTGKMVDGKAKAGEIQVQDGGKSEKYESVDKVPEQYRDKVKNLIEITGKTRIDILER